MRTIQKLRAFLLVVIFLAPATAGAWPQPAPAAAPRPAQGDPYLTPIRDGGFGDFVVGGGFLYYTVGDDLLWPFFRKPENGGPDITLSTNTNYYAKSADDQGVYYDWGSHVGPHQLMTRPADHPETEIQLAQLAIGYPSYAVTDDDYVYYFMGDGIYRAHKDSPGGVRISDASDVVALAVDDANIYWLGSAGLWRSLKTCTSPSCWQVKTRVCAAAGFGLSWSDSAHLLYTGEGTTPPTWSIMQAEAAGTDSCYWIHYEYKADATIYQAAISEGYLFWIERRSGYPTYELRRCEVAGYCPVVDTLYESTELETDRLYATPGGVIFGDHYISSLGVYRMSYDAPPLAKDLKLLGIEVAQAIQDLDVDDDSPLIAGKPTYVRVYSTLVGTAQSNAAEVWLECPAGVPCYEPYLKPLQWEDVPSNRAVPDRAQGAWLFLLPAEWTAAGGIILQAEIDPRHIYDDPDPANNTLSTAVIFHAGTPVCTVMIPVRTPAGKGSTNSATFWPMVDRAWRMWPTSEMRVYKQSEPVEELEFCWWGIFPGWCWGPYELAGDSNWILNTLRDRDNLSDDPDECDDDGARTHYVGLVHENSKTEGVNGAARIGADGSYDCDQVWVWLSRPSESKSGTIPWTYPRAGFTFAHELGHNYERKHVKCPVDDPPAHTDPNYPYNTCQIDDGDLSLPSTHFGFDTLTALPIGPHTTADLMSYGSPRWPSDYTWRGMYNNIGLQGLEPQAAPAGPDLSQAESNVLVTGVFTPSLGQGRLGYAWVYPTALLSPGILAKWQRMAAPTVAQAAGTQQTVYHLRLRDGAGNVVDDRLIEPLEISEGPEGTLFSLAFPAPASAVAHLELLIDDTVVDNLHAGLQTPSVQIVQPAGGTFDQEMTLVWEASDADALDRLLYSVQYSPDNGQTWKALLTNVPSLAGEDRVTLTLSSFGGLPGGASALVRVAASDGYHTGLATSAAFQVLTRAPEPYIVTPQPTEVIPAGRPYVLRGGAIDAEDGTIDASSLEWSLSPYVHYQGGEVTPRLLAPGTYPITLTATDSDGQTGAAYADLTIAPLHVPRASGGAPALDGFCDDAFYDNGVSLPLRAYAGGGQPQAHLVRTITDLYVCLSGMERGLTTTLSFAGLAVDVDENAGQFPQTDDRAFWVYEDGSPAARTGTGSAWTESAADMSARVAGNDDTWSAELRIDRGELGNWNNTVLLSVFHAYLVPGGALQSWPEIAGYGQPNSWGRAIFAQVPHIDVITPTEAIAGRPVAVTIHGTGIDSAIAYVLWNGAQRLATVDDGVITPVLWDSDFATAGVVEVQVDNYGSGAGDESNTLLFPIYNPTPTISLLTPASAQAGGPALDLIVDGADFVPGATVLWNGEALATAWITTTRLQAAVPAAALAVARAVAVTVVNPEPSLAVSGEATFQVLRVPAPYAVYLPLVQRGSE